MNEIESEGKTIEDAIKKGLATLGLAKEDVDIKILSEGTSGLFGLRGAKPAKVMLQQKLKAGGKGESVSLPADKEKKIENYAKEQIAKIINLMGFSDAKPEYVFQEKAGNYDLNINVSDSRTSSILIGKNGKTLKAFKIVLQSMINNKFKDFGVLPRISVDVNNYNIRQEEKLGELVDETTKQVKKTGKPFKLDPMPAHMRKVVHTLLQNSEEFETISEGEGEERSVVIKPKK